MSRASGSWRYGLASLGSAGVIVSMWLPWYSLRIPAAALDQAVQEAQQFGALGPIVRRGAAILSSLGTIHFNAWDVLHQADIAIVLAAAAAGGLALLAAPGRASGVRPVIVAGGVVALAVTFYRTVVPPGHGGYVHAAWGAYVAVACAVVALIGGVLATPEDSEPSWTPPDPAPVDQMSAWRTAGSIAPPGGTG